MAVTRKKAPQPAGKPASAKTQTRIFRVALQARRSIWREVEVRPQHSLYQLAEVAVAAFDFHLDHAFGFYPVSGPAMYRATPRYELFTDLGEPTDPGAFGVEKVSVASAFPEVGKRMTLLFDYGDEWLFDVELTGIGQAEPRARYPRFLRQRGKAPAQYPSFDDDDAD